MAETAYPNSSLLVSTEWLADHLDDPDLRVVDCDNRDAYRRAHIPGSVCPREHYMKGGDGRLIMPADQFAAEAGRLGIGDGTLVVCYDGFGSLYAARFWWCLRYYGHDHCVVLNGGWNKWLAEGRQATYAEPHPARATFTPSVREDVLCTMDGLKQRVGRQGAVIWDVRSDAEWEGKNDRGNKRAGHVPGAVHLEWLNCVTDDDFKTIRPAAELRSLLDRLGIRPEQEVVTY